MSKINAYINFNNNCREAMSFYHQCLGGELKMQAVNETPMAAMFPADAQDTILHADLTAGDLTLLGSDMQDKTVTHKIGGPVSLVLICANKTEMQSAFDKLAEGGTITHTPGTFFAGTMGNLTDKFGIKWGVFTDEK